jgi:hypothetical protein
MFDLSANRIRILPVLNRAEVNAPVDIHEQQATLYHISADSHPIA